MLGSTSFAEAFAELAIVPGRFGRTRMVTLVWVPLARPPRLQVTTPELSEHVPWRGETETKLTPVGSASTTVIPVAGSGPMFRILIQYLRRRPTWTGSRLSRILSFRSARPRACTAVFVESMLFVAFGSPVEEATDAVAAIVPAELGTTSMRTEAPVPAGIGPSKQATVPAAGEQVPCEGIADPKVTPAGSVAVTATPAA